MRDGYCRLAHAPFGACDGPSEFAHLPPRRRWQTRGMAPEHRHAATHAAMLCKWHHGLLDAHEIDTDADATPATGPMAWTYGDTEYREAA